MMKGTVELVFRNQSQFSRCSEVQKLAKKQQLNDSITSNECILKCFSLCIVSNDFSPHESDIKKQRQKEKKNKF